jgi:predicted oxidoreductase
MQELKKNVVEINTTAHENKMDIELIKHDIKNIRKETTTHNKQTEKDFALIHKKIDKLDNRLWWLAGIIIAATMGPLIAGMIT